MHEKRELDELALVIVVLRALSGLTQAELAELAGTTASVISEYETGRRRPSRKAVERFAEVLDIPSHKIDSLLPALRTLRQSTRQSLSALSEESLALKAARDLESLVIEALGMALMNHLEETAFLQERGAVEGQKRLGTARAAGTDPPPAPDRRRSRVPDLGSL